MDNTLKVRVNEELLDYYKGNPDMMKEALTMFKRSKEKFLSIYEKESTE